MNKFRFWATLLDAYDNFVNSETIWEQYWGWSEKPPHTPEQFKALQKQSLVDSINRVDGEPSKAADRGTCFNEVIDCLILNQPTKRDDITIAGDKERGVIVAQMDGFTFEFPTDLCRQFAAQYTQNGAKAVPQFRCEGVLHLSTADVTLYGYIDELMPYGVHDIKTTKSYTVGKFRNHWQHRVYPYCLGQMGIRSDYFQYDVVEFSGKQISTYKEFYPTFDKGKIEVELERQCTELIAFINDNIADIDRSTTTIFG